MWTLPTRINETSIFLYLFPSSLHERDASSNRSIASFVIHDRTEMDKTTPFLSFGMISVSPVSNSFSVTLLKHTLDRLTILLAAIEFIQFKSSTSPHFYLLSLWLILLKNRWKEVMCKINQFYHMCEIASAKSSSYLRREKTTDAAALGATYVMYQARGKKSSEKSFCFSWMAALMRY